MNRRSLSRPSVIYGTPGGPDGDPFYQLISLWTPWLEELVVVSSGQNDSSCWWLHLDALSVRGGAQENDAADDECDAEEARRADGIA